MEQDGAMYCVTRFLPWSSLSIPSMPGVRITGMDEPGQPIGYLAVYDNIGDAETDAEQNGGTVIRLERLP
jgi:hypothetical protein